jgi:outer membrane immunogenic protein
MEIRRFFMTKKGYLLATAAGAAVVAAAGGANAADMAMPYKAPALEPAAASWTGWYIGANVGAAWEHSTNSGYGYGGNTGGSTAHTGLIGGGQIGYNWQQGNFVFGLEGDISGLTGTGTNAQQPYGSTEGYNFSNRIDWLSTVRARFGLAVGDTMVYTTGGLAIGGVKNSYNNYGAVYSQSSTRVGWAVGAGVEHMLWNSHWTVGLEGLFVDLGQSSVTGYAGKTAKFSNEAVIGRLKVNYKF